MSDVSGRANFEQLYQQVLAQLADGRYRPGERIGVKDLASRLRVSPTPLREILSRLVGRELVEERRSEGYYLCRLDARDISDLYRLHLLCVTIALRRDAVQQAGWRDNTVSAWVLLQRIVDAADDHILSGVRHYLIDRITLLRRAEMAVLEHSPAEQTAAIDLSSAPTQNILRTVVQAFHNRRIKAAQEIAILLGRSTPESANISQK
jgi:DNA-binding GntR family transcriptional regulator